MDANERKDMFKTTFKGFDKKGVIEFIRMLSAKYDEDISSKSKELDNYKTKYTEADSKLVKATAEIDELKAQVSELTDKNNKLSEENSNLKAEKSKLEDNMNQLNDSFIPAKLSEKCALEDKVESLKAELEEFRAENERNKVEIAEVLIKAEQLARKLQEEAVVSANTQKAEIERQIVSKKSELLGINGEIERMKNVFSDLYNRYVSK